MAPKAALRPQRGRSPARRSPSAARSEDWSHPDGFPISEVEVGGTYDGVVTSAHPSMGVFVNFGAVKDGWLRVPSKYRNSYRRGMELSGLTVLTCDTQTGRVTLEQDEDDLKELVPRSRSRSRSQSAARSYSRRRTYVRKRRDHEHPEGVPLEEVQEGTLMEGTVTCVNRFGVFVDFGAVKDGRLDIRRALARHIKVGDAIRDCTVEVVDVERGRVTLSVQDQEGLIEELDAERSPVEDFEEGTLVDGFVQNVSSYGVFVNIGAVKDARLRAPKRIAYQYTMGQQVQGMVVAEVDYERQWITVTPNEKETAFAFSAQRPPAKADVRPKAREAVSVPKPRPKPQPASPAPKPKPKPKPVAKTKALPPPPEPEEDDDGLIPLEDVQVGEIADGVVVRVAPRGVVVDIGVTRMGLLTVSEDLKSQFQKGDMVEGMRIDSVDVQRQQITLSMEDPELAINSDEGYVEEVQVPKPKPKPKAKTKTRAKSVEPALEEPGARARTKPREPRAASQDAGPGARAKAQAKPRAKGIMRAA